MNRRTVLKGVGTLGAAGATGGAGIAYLTRGASASATTDIEDPDPATTDDGRIKWVAVQTTGRLEWDGFDDPARYGRIIVDVVMKRDGEVVWTGEIHDTGMIDLSQDDWGSAGDEVHLGGDYGEGRAGYIASDADWGIIQRNREHIYNDGYPLPENPAPADRLYANEDDSTKQTNVELVSEYRLYDADQNELTGTSGYPDRPEAVGTFTVTVNNEGSETSFGDADAQDDTDDTAEIGT